jgi:hypothetical protein
MAIDLTLLQTHASGPHLPTKLAHALTLLATRKTTEPTPKAAMHGHELRVALEGSLDDASCCAFLLDFGAQGARVRGTAHGPSAPALAWTLHTLAAALKCTLHDAEANADIPPAPAAYRAAAAAYLARYEDEVQATRSGDEEEDAAAFLDWLAREEHIAIAPDGIAGITASTASLSLEDASALYEMLLESNAVEDVFVSESELTSLLGRFRARRR